ncbi:hypothetical protein SCLCIDRAFT_1182630, partial [Scleroderma citrinum Foug A]
EKIREVQKILLVHQEIVPKLLTWPLPKSPAYLGHIQNMLLKLHASSLTARITMIFVSSFSQTPLKKLLNKGGHDASLLHLEITLIRHWRVQFLNMTVTQSSSKQLWLIRPYLLCQ